MSVRPPNTILPPDLPGLDKADPALVNYLRTFSLWCRKGFDKRPPNDQAQSSILLRATDAATGLQTNFVYKIGLTVTVTGGVASAPTITFTSVPLGSGLP
jgi:hypothetical protein